MKSRYKKIYYVPLSTGTEYMNKSGLEWNMQERFKTDDSE